MGKEAHMMGSWMACTWHLPPLCLSTQLCQVWAHDSNWQEPCSLPDPERKSLVKLNILLATWEQGCQEQWGELKMCSQSARSPGSWRGYLQGSEKCNWSLNVIVFILEETLICFCCLACFALFVVFCLFVSFWTLKLSL